MARPLKKLVTDDLVKLRGELVYQEGYTPGSTKQYESLSCQIFSKTGVLLSVSTLQRFFDEKTGVLPSSTTLDTLARYLGSVDYADWVRGKQFGQRFLTYLGKLSQGEGAKSMNAISNHEVWTSENQTWFQTGLLMTPVAHWDELFTEAQFRMKTWEDLYLSGLVLALSMRNGQIDVTSLPEKVINHPFFMERITTYFIDEERPNWYLALMPRAEECPEKFWLTSDKKAIDFSLNHLRDLQLMAPSLREWDRLMQLTDKMSNVPIARLAACFSQIDADRKSVLLDFIDSWFGSISHDDQLRTSQFLIRQLQRADWPVIKEIIDPYTQQFKPRNTQQSIEVKHFNSLVNALEKRVLEPAIFYHLHNSEMHRYHWNRIINSL
jgi:hypothetical protein